MEFYNMDKPPLEVPTMSVREIAAKHGVSVAVINAQLTKGIEVELEHTTSKSVATEIALDHLMELPDYYDRLHDMENQEDVSEMRKMMDLFK